MSWYSSTLVGGSGLPAAPIGAGTDGTAHASGDDVLVMSSGTQVEPAALGLFGLSEQRLREGLEDELLRQMRVEGGAPTVHAIAASIARILEEDHLRMADQLRAAGVSLEPRGAGRTMPES